MPVEVTLGPNTSLGDIALWPLDGGELVVFHFTHDSSFGLLTEAAGVAAYQSIRKQTQKIVVKLRYTTDEVKNLEAYISRSKILYSIFGLNLIRTCDEFVDSSGRDIKEIVIGIVREELLRDRDGTILKGEKTWVVSQWPAPPVPRCLTPSGEQRAPEPDDVAALLHQLRFRYERNSRNLGRTWNLNQRPIVSFVYETFRNIIEHAAIAESGCCGILIERVFLTGPQDASRYVAGSVRLRDYLTSFFKTEQQTRSADFTAITVFDYGLGIQRTLPPTPGETERDTVIRAFDKGVSSKPRSGTPYYGQGLTEVARAAVGLGAFVVIRSRGVLISFDARNEATVGLREQRESASWRRSVGDRIPGLGLSVIFPNKLIHRAQQSFEM